MNEYIFVGPTPCDEACAQLGSNDYEKISRKECRAFINQIWRVAKNTYNVDKDGVIGFDVITKNEYHDFGTYREVVLKFDYNNILATEFAYKMDEIIPTTWDEEAKQELGL